MIPLKFGLFWSGTELSYLRYLTFVSLRKHHPDAEIELYVAKSSVNDITWGNEKQDFQRSDDGQDFLEGMNDIGVKVIESDLFPTYAPNYQSDFFRWWWLYHNGGFYLDTDQIILKSFEGLPLDSDLIYSIYNAKSCGIYSPVGVIGAQKGNPVVKQIMEEMASLYDPKDYNSIGPFMFRNLFLKNREKWESENKMFNAPPHLFYPVSESYMVNVLYKEGISFDFRESIATHWFGGHPLSQKFNSMYTEELAKTSNDTISRLLRRIKIV